MSTEKYLILLSIYHYSLYYQLLELSVCTVYEQDPFFTTDTSSSYLWSDVDNVVLSM
jgi:hypothetical protein